VLLFYATPNCNRCCCSMQHYRITSLVALCNTEEYQSVLLCATAIPPNRARGGRRVSPTISLLARRAVREPPSNRGSPPLHRGPRAVDCAALLPRHRRTRPQSSPSVPIRRTARFVCRRRAFGTGQNREERTSLRHRIDALFEVGGYWRRISTGPPSEGISQWR
jgi:hypothetical protein